MSGTLEILLLATLAVGATVLLQQGGRGGYGWVSGAEFAIAGLVIGPVGLDLVSASLLEQARPVLAVGVGWLGFRFGLGLRRSRLKAVPHRLLLASQVEALLALLVLRGLLEVANRSGVFDLNPMTCWCLAAVGAATAPSAISWARERFAAQGPLTDALLGLTAFDDLAGLLVIAGVYAWVRPPLVQLPPGIAATLVATLLLGAALGVLILLITGFGAIHAELVWVALLGACALGVGLSARLGLCPAAVMALAGIVSGWVSPHAESFARLTRPTERPAMQLILVLGAAQAGLDVRIVAVALLFAVLRSIAKLAVGAAVGATLMGAASAPLGLGLLAGSGFSFALTLGLAAVLPQRDGQVLIVSACAMVSVGDVLGSSALRMLLIRRGELSGALPPPLGGAPVQATP